MISEEEKLRQVWTASQLAALAECADASPKVGHPKVTRVLDAVKELGMALDAAHEAGLAVGITPSMTPKGIRVNAQVWITG